MQDGYQAVTISPAKAAASAYSDDTRLGIRKASLWKVWLVAADCCLIGLQPVLVHLSKQGKDGYAFHPLSVNLLIELVRVLFAVAMLAAHGSGRPGPPAYRSLASWLRDARLNRALAVPALLYSANNWLKFSLQLYFKPTTAKMLGNLKVLVIAVLMRAVLRRSFSLLQWEALLLLCVGITVSQLDSCADKPAALPAAAIACAGASLVVPSLASIFNEWALKRQMDTSLHLQNCFLYSFSAAANAAGLLAVSAASGRPLLSLFRGHSRYTLLLVVNNAAQGVLSSFFFKYADTILKKYSSTIATIWTALLSAALFGHKLTLSFALGVVTVFCSMHLFFGQGGLKAGAGAGSLGGKAKAEPPPELSPPQRLRPNSASFSALESDLLDPDNSHLVPSRREHLPSHHWTHHPGSV